MKPVFVGVRGYSSPIATIRTAEYYEVVNSDFSECPANPEEIAEAYVMGTMTAEQATAFEDHYIGCDTCATVLYKTADFVDAMSAAANRVREKREG